LEQLQRIKPKYHIFGHIHEQGGEFLEKDGIKFYNVAKHYKIFNLNENEVKTVI
jgi:Icc-related predicted phosphoesterase